LLALVDTGSPISFICNQTFKKFFNPSDLSSSSQERCKTIEDTQIKVSGTVSTVIKLEIFPNFSAKALFHVLQKNTFDNDIIIGRNFLNTNKISCLYDPLEEEINNKIKLFTEIVAVDIVEPVNELKDSFSDIKIDFDNTVKKQLVSILIEVENTEIEPINLDYFIKVRLKNESIYSYSPRRFAWAERLQIREVVENLLERNIVKHSISPYCTRIVPVRKRDGNLRLCIDLCIDLRPLNERVIKQRYSFPLIEDCLTKLSNKTVFTLLDIKDGFHNIKIHSDHTQYFSFATPDGQYEYTKLPFGYCEAPAEFQKRLIMILRSLIEKDKIIVYIDDILIPTETINENLEILKETLLLLKKHKFQVNYTKCSFLKQTIEYLGYNITSSKITLSPRHTQAVADFPTPKKILELQRFLGRKLF